MIYRDTWAQINLDHLAYNYEAIKKYSQKEVFCVLKANAYGHGDYVVARQLQQLGCKHVAVSSLDEALSLRNHGYSEDILVLGYVKKENVEKAIVNDISVALTSLEWLENLKDIVNLSKMKVHIKVDTGMNRLGLKRFDELQKCMQLLKEYSICIEGIFTHYHSASNTDKSACIRQRTYFQKVVEFLDYDFKWIHSANSDASVSFEDDGCNAIRIGLLLYGVKSIESDIIVKPVLSLYTRISSVKEVKAQEVVGYNATYTSRKDEWIATIPIGYGDGFITKNQGRFVSVDHRACEIVGRVCMDITMIRLAHRVPLDTKVEIIGEDIRIEEMAAQLGMIPYEVLCLLGDRIPRIFMKEGIEVACINLRTNN